MHNHNEVMDSLKSKLNMILEVVPKGSKVLYLDYPVHLNVGDLLIYQGTLEFFRQSEYEVVGSYTLYDGLNETIKNKISDDVVIMFHGGGSFGDIYPALQKFRETIIGAYPNNRLVVMPQTCHFNSPVIKQTSSEVFKNHADVHIYCRDETSLSVAKDFTHKAYLCPDMAHCLWQGKDSAVWLSKGIANGGGNLYQKRIDNEFSDSAVAIEKDGFEIFDWVDVVPVWGRLACRILTTYARIIGRYLVPTNFNSKIWEVLSKVIIDKAAKKIISSDQFMTTRLHGHIFAMLLSKQHVPLDNNYGKISNYKDCWTKGSSLFRK